MRPVRVMELADPRQLGPCCTQMLGDWGADVIWNFSHCSGPIRRCGIQRTTPKACSMRPGTATISSASAPLLQCASMSICNGRPG